MKHIGVIAGVVALFVALTAFVYLLQSGFQLTQPKKAYTHLHCPQCRLEITFTSGMEGKTCPQCGGSGPKFVPTVGPSQAGESYGELGNAGKLLAAAFISLLVTVAATYGGILRYKAKQSAEAQAEYRMLVCRCPFCNRRIGFQANKLGAGTQCPRCKTAFILTDGEERDDARGACP